MAEHIIAANDKHESLYAELAEVMNKYSDDLDAVVIMCVAANMVGKLLAMQDQRKYTVATLLKMIDRNIELGNKQMIDNLMNSQGNA